MALEFFDAAGNASAAGIFIPVSDLPGALAAELEAADSLQSKIAQFVSSALKAVRNAVSGTSYLATQTAGNILGISLAVTETVPSVGLRNRTYSLSSTYLADKVAKTYGMIPLNPDDDGALLITDIFPNAEKVAAAGAVDGAGVVVSSADLELYGGYSHAALNLATSDGRMWLSSFMTYLYSTVTLRTTSVASAFTSQTRTYTSTAIPAIATDATTPATGIDAADLPFIALVTDTLSVTLQTIEADDETVSVNVVTA